ncbi:MAG: MFS transporter, partial [Acidimicrobiales bacterium]
MTVIYGFLVSPVLLMGLAMVEALGQGIGAPACQSAMVECTNEGERATGQGLVAAASSIGAGIAALIAAPLYAGPGPEITFVIVAGVVFVLSVIATKLSGFKFRKPIREVLPYG